MQGFITPQPRETPPARRRANEDQFRPSLILQFGAKTPTLAAS